MHLVDQSGLKVLPHGGNPAAEADIFALRRIDSSLQRGLNAIRDKVERSASAHRDRCARVIRENKDCSVIRRSVAPPALPGVVRPASANRPEHVAPDNPRADTVEAAQYKIIVSPCCAAILAVHFMVGPRGKLPPEDRQAANAYWIVDVLVGAGAVTIGRYRKAMDTKLGHKDSFSLRVRGYLPCIA